MDFRPKKTLKGAWIPKIWLKIWWLVQSEPPKVLGNRGKLQHEKLHQSLSCYVIMLNINNLQYTLESLLLQPCNMKLGYFYILVLISVDFLWTFCGIPCKWNGDPRCRRRCVHECKKTFDNGRKTCCEGRGPVERGGTWSQLCNSGRIDINAYVLWSKRIALLWGEAQLSLLKEK